MDFRVTWPHKMSVLGYDSKRDSPRRDLETSALASQAMRHKIAVVDN